MESGSHFDSSRAELFEALGHPTRVKILRTLETKPMGFAELKREVGIESSGHLQFHLGKLNGLVSTDAEGSYILTDDGREAIRVLKAIPTNSDQIPLVRRAPKIRANWVVPLLAMLLIAVVILAGVAVYQQEQIAALNRNLSSDTVVIGGTRYYYEYLSPALVQNGTSFLFHGVVFTILQPPFWQIIPNTENEVNYSGPLRLANGTILNLNGKTVIINMTGFFMFLLAGRGNVSWIQDVGFPYPSVSMTFSDGSQVIHPAFSITAKHQNAYNVIAKPVYILTFNYLPTVQNPWVTQHANTYAGIYWNFTNGNWPLTLCVSAQT